MKRFALAIMLVVTAAFVTGCSSTAKKTVSKNSTEIHHEGSY